jgi:hypothetical protein
MTTQYLGVMVSGIEPVLAPTDMENTPPEKITDIGHIHNPNLYFEYSAYKNCRYQIYLQVDARL